MGDQTEVNADVGAGLQVAVALREVSGDELLHQSLGILVEIPVSKFICSSEIQTPAFDYRLVFGFATEKDKLKNTGTYLKRIWMSKPKIVQSLKLLLC